MSKRVQHGIYYAPRVNGEYIKLGPNDLSKKSIPKKDRCEGFDELWNKTYNEVMNYWNFVPITDMHEFDQYQKIKED